MNDSNPAAAFPARIRCILFAACILTAAGGYFETPVASQDTRRPPREFRLTRKTLKPSDRQAIYLELIEDFIGYAEHSRRFESADTLEPGGGYFDAAGSGVTWFRGNGNLCIAYAVLLSRCPDRQEFTRYNIPRSVLFDHLRRTLRSLCLSNKNCSRYVPESHSWGGPDWQPALGVVGAAWAAHLMEASLDEDTRSLVADVLAKEADNLDKPIPSAAPGNTGAEDCCWNAPLLAFAANKLSHDPRAGKWNELAKRWAINAVSIPGDHESDRLLDGRPLREWVASTNVFPDLTLENHGFWSVPYQFEYQLLGEAEIAYRAFEHPLPEAFAFRAETMWNNVTGVLSLWDGDTLFPQGLDWAWKDYQHLEYFCRLATCLNISAAGAFESRALQMTLKRQRAVGEGHLGAADFGYETHLLKKWAFCYLMHEYFKTDRIVEFRDAEQDLLGIHIFPNVKTAIHRTPQKLVSVSWHPRSQAIFILPEGDSTFADPPFFIAYDRMTACPSVEVTPEDSGRMTASSREEGYPILNARDDDDSTFWVSAGEKPGEGPTPSRPEWIQYDFEQRQAVAGIAIRPRVRYAPRDCELQYSANGSRFETLRRFSLDNAPRFALEFDPVQARIVRLPIRSAYHVGYPEAPRSVQVREFNLLDEAGNPLIPPVGPIGEMRIENPSVVRDGRTMRARYERVWGDAVRQYVSVVSFDEGPTVYLTAFRADNRARVTLGSLFSVRTQAPPGFARPVRQYRGTRWLNLSDHLAFVSPDPLPSDIPADRFFMTDARTFQARRGEWFSPAGLVIYTRQDHFATEALAPSVRWRRPPRNRRLELAIAGEDGTRTVIADFAGE
jgi:hypothetical protein